MSAESQTGDAGPQSAREILDELHSDDSVARVAAQIETGDGDASGDDILRTLALAEDRLCLIFEHDCGHEYVWLTDGWQGFDARLRRDRDGAIITTTLSVGDLEHRLAKLADVALVGSTPVTRPDGGVE